MRNNIQTYGTGVSNLIRRANLFWFLLVETIVPTFSCDGVWLFIICSWKRSAPSANWTGKRCRFIWSRSSKVCLNPPQQRIEWNQRVAHVYVCLLLYFFLVIVSRESLISVESDLDEVLLEQTVDIEAVRRSYDILFKLKDKGEHWDRRDHIHPT